MKDLNLIEIDKVSGGTFSGIPTVDTALGLFTVATSWYYFNLSGRSYYLNPSSGGAAELVYSQAPSSKLLTAGAFATGLFTVGKNLVEMGALETLSEAVNHYLP